MESISSYNLREKDLSVLLIAWHRAVAVIIGVAWAALLSRFVWPAEARKELSKGLGELSSRFGYTRNNTHLFANQILLEYWMALYTFGRLVFIRAGNSSPCGR